MRFLTVSALVFSAWWMSGCGPASFADHQDNTSINAEQQDTKGLENPYCKCVKAPCSCPMMKPTFTAPVGMDDAPQVMPVMSTIKPPMQCVCTKLPCNCFGSAEPTEKMGNFLGANLKMAAPACSSVTGCQQPCMPFDQDCINKRKALGATSDLMDRDGDSFGATMDTPMKLVCQNGLMLKLAAGAPAPDGCSWVPVEKPSAMMNQDGPFAASLNPPMKLECKDGRSYKLAAGAPAPEGCEWVSITSSVMNADDNGLSLPDSISSSAMRPKTCMCIKAPCNCATPPAPIKEVEELY